jgi:hypothetical protein
MISGLCATRIVHFFSTSLGLRNSSLNAASSLGTSFSFWWPCAFAGALPRSVGGVDVAAKVRKQNVVPHKDINGLNVLHLFLEPLKLLFGQLRGEAPFNGWGFLRFDFALRRAATPATRCMRIAKR